MFLKSMIVFFVTMSSTGWSAKLVDVKNYQEDGRFVSEMIFNEPVSSDKLAVDFINETVQVDIPGGVVPGGKLHRTVDDPMVRSTFTYQADDDTLRNRIIYKGIPADSFAEKVDLVATQNSLKIMIGEKTVPVATPAKKDIVAAKPPRSLASESKNTTDNSAPSDDEQTEALLAQIEQEQAPAVDLKAAKEEESIPVLLKDSEVSEAESDPIMRMMLSLGIIALMAVIGLIVLRRIKARSPTNASQTQIKILTQHHLGSKKSLAIIRVAGESILIGITDHNINMIKSLSLLDDDIPEELPGEFPGVLGKIFDRDANRSGLTKRKKKTKSKDEDDDFAIEGIKDIVSSRLKDMRSID